MLDLAEEFVVQGGHPVVIGNTREEVHQDQLGVTLSTVSGLGLLVLLLVSALDNQHRGDTTVLPPEISCIDLSSVVLLRSCGDGDVGLRRGFGIKGRVEFHQTGTNVGCRTVVSRSCNDTVADNKEQLLVVGVFGRSQGLDCRPEGRLSLRVTGNQEDGMKFLYIGAGNTGTSGGAGQGSSSSTSSGTSSDGSRTGGDNG